ncbi:hypothetical protein GLAREA_07507 [Glarea lozoyensis ATCC 20868]|uniref:Transcriptional regulatory protein RXT2 N-terminal domain-containing protein n=1 Tax=Glarea lozoyensis (strain ATCC 20868 / MF5171) TaxID=1116229 RepID=S3D5I8_GLAL2|nr:uncharacterized protein GLAREA_07507 [Glarea lozoyensis ATCC 20868]EPE32374.1 hypothetical protein GLAREA_07507 [Glarea lozoyensis ATCC 20868]
MASQAAIFAETIAGMKKAVKRKDYDSDSDDSIEELTNRGNKLKRKSRFVREGQLAPPSGPQVYRKKIEHAGYYRDTISQNPPLIDDDGYDVDSDEDDERTQAAINAATELDPYADVKIEDLLMPLTSASDLPNHPTLSKPFVSNTLTELTQHAGNMVQKEKASLWRIKHLLTRLSGDNTWIPCESVEAEDDVNLFFDEREKIRAHIGKLVAKDDADQASTGTLVSEEAENVGLLESVAHATQTALETLKEPNAINNGLSASDAARGQVAKVTHPSVDQVNGSGESTKPKSPPIPSQAMEDRGETGYGETNETVDEVMDMEVAVKEAVAQIEGNEIRPVEEVGDVDVDAGTGDTEEVPAPRRMRTRAQAQAASDNTASSRTRSASPDSDTDGFIHPYFLAPKFSHPDRDCGLPANEAEETRRLLQLYIQKQEEVCRGAQRIYEGLLRADRYRQLVMKWAKAEAHVGVNRDMSDGEDWYDKEEWQLDEDLKKGQDEEEEDAATTAKKTRTRRQ